MSDFDLLEAVQPSDGWFSVLGIKEGVGVRQHMVATRTAADAVVQEFSKNQFNVYFGVAKFATKNNRTKDNVRSLKSFWLDIDCGEAKAVADPKTGRPDGYLTQTEGLLALQDFCKLVKLPKPILVNSGRGIHVYWALTEEITREQWEPVAAKLQRLCITHNFYIDPACFEVARVLRVPGTYNYKDDPPTLVEVLSSAPPVDFEAFASILGADTTPKKEPPKQEKEPLTPLAQSLMDNNMSSFDKIMRRSAKGTGCAQLADSYKNRTTLSEPRWFDALSVAKFCEDRDTAIHKISEGYEGYDPDTTEAKIRHIVGPHTCSVFERNNPGGCDGCPFQGKIKSPIVLGREIRESEEEAVVTVEANPADASSTAQTYVIPKYPDPYFRGENGGIYRRAEGDEGTPLLIYDRDLYVVRRMYDPIEFDVMVFRLHTATDGVREFIVPNTKASDVGEFRKALAARGVMCGAKQFALITDYLLIAINKLQHTKKAEHMRLQFGWADNDSKFIVGDREISAAGTFHSPPSSTTAPIAAHIGPVGSLDKWKEVAALYGRPGLEAHAFAMLTAFGSPLFKFTGQRGAIINVVHPKSGTGKTTILHMCNSVWGNPSLLCSTQADKPLAKVHRMGVMGNLPYTCDEMTNTTPQEFSDLAYGMSQGRGRDRMQSSVNQLRHNSTTWQLISLCSSNASFYEKLYALKASPEGELMRLMEFKIDHSNAIEPAHAKDMFDHQLMQNYGHAGPIYAEWLVNNREEAIKSLMVVQSKIDRELKLTPRERFWSAVDASNIAGGLIAKKLGLLDWDMRSIYKFATDKTLALREEVSPPATDSVSVLGDYIYRHMQNILVVNDAVDQRSKMELRPVREPKGELLIRYEPDTKKLYIIAANFKSDCVKYQINYRDTLQSLAAKGVFIKGDTVRLSKGMKMVGFHGYCLIFDCSNEEFSDVNAFIEDDKSPDDSGEG